ncbi:MAG TPA: hypothetical protein VFI91_09245 [Longimicrobiaceae bacterium]|nr:hypothetical protein [Longimicrobiaceae bacterium]
MNDTTLGGYTAVHGRAAAFEGPDGQPYTTAIETEHTESAEYPWAAYLVFLRWAQSGGAIMGHLETENIAEAATEAEARDVAESLPLGRVKQLLDEAIARKASDFA